MAKPTKDWICNDISQPPDRSCIGRVLLQRNVSSHGIIIGDIFCKNLSKVICVERNQMIRALAIDPIKRSTYPFCQRERNEVVRSRIPVARSRALNAPPNALSLSRMRYFGTISHGNASVICRASHSVVLTLLMLSRVAYLSTSSQITAGPVSA
jgi:hypothetical protein